MLAMERETRSPVQRYFCLTRYTVTGIGAVSYKPHIVFENDNACGNVHWQRAEISMLLIVKIIFLRGYAATA